MPYSPPPPGNILKSWMFSIEACIQIAFFKYHFFFGTIVVLLLFFIFLVFPCFILLFVLVICAFYICMFLMELSLLIKNLNLKCYFNFFCLSVLKTDHFFWSTLKTSLPLSGPLLLICEFNACLFPIQKMFPR